MTAPPSVAVIIPTRNRKDLLLACLNTLADQSYPASQFEIIVVDDASTDGTSEVAMQWFRDQQDNHQGKVLRIATKGGPAAARNEGIAACHGELIAFIDDDCLAQTTWIGELVRDAEKGHFGGVGGQVRPIRTQNETLAQAHMRRHAWYEQLAMLNGEPDFLLTMNCIYRRATLEYVAGFDDSFIAAGGEDTDLGRRVRAAGFKLSFNPEAIVYHRARESSLDILRTAYRYGVGAGMISFRYPQHESKLPTEDRKDLRVSLLQAAKLAALNLLVLIAARLGRQYGFRRAKNIALHNKRR